MGEEDKSIKLGGVASCHFNRLEELAPFLPSFPTRTELLSQRPFIDPAALRQLLSNLTPAQSPQSPHFPTPSCSLSTPVKMPVDQPMFTFCGSFSGKDGVPAVRWLKRFEHEMSVYKDTTGIIPAEKYLESLDLLLTDDAAFWAKSYPDASRLLAGPVYD
ncbi:MAG: hypothetical protein Q9176_005120 [Flavoplaca citrina]